MLSQFNFFYKSVVRGLKKASWLPPLIARIGTGILFVVAGWGKVQHPGKFVTEFVNWGIPVPNVLAPFVAWTEFLGGALLIVGLLTRISSFALMVDMIVATFVAQMDKVHGASDFFYLSEVQLAIVFLWLTIEGAGRVSLDHAISGRVEHKPERVDPIDWPESMSA